MDIYFDGHSISPSFDYEKSYREQAGRLGIVCMKVCKKRLGAVRPKAAQAFLLKLPIVCNMMGSASLGIDSCFYKALSFTSNMEKIVMKNLIVSLLMGAAFLVSPAFAVDDPALAVAMVEKGLAYLQKNGKDALIKEINSKNPEFVKENVYLTMRALDGKQLAHPTNLFAPKFMILKTRPPGAFQSEYH